MAAPGPLQIKSFSVHVHLQEDKTMAKRAPRYDSSVFQVTSPEENNFANNVDTENASVVAHAHAARLIPESGLFVFWVPGYASMVNWKRRVIHDARTVTQTKQLLNKVQNNVIPNHAAFALGEGRFRG